MIRWLHTDPLNGEGNAEMTEKKIGEEPDQEDPDQEPSCERGKKELLNSVIDGHDVRSLIPLSLEKNASLRQARNGEGFGSGQEYQIRPDQYSAKLSNLQKIGCGDSFFRLSEI